MDTPKIIYEDDSLLVVDKPSGYVVNDSNTVSKDPSLQEWVKKNIKSEISGNGSLRNGIVHRLDKPTSGIILIAKNENVFKNLQAQFKNREVKKTYVSLVHGKVEEGEGEINAPIGRLPWNRMRFGVFAGGREAVTRYKTLKQIDDYTLLELYPQTGRTHQIRVHLKHIGHPIVADPLYAGRKTVREDLKTWPRLWLVAKSIEFSHPVTGKRVKFEAPLPTDLKLPYT